MESLIIFSFFGKKKQFSFCIKKIFDVLDVFHVTNNHYTHFARFFAGSPAAASSKDLPEFNAFDVELNRRRKLFNRQLSARHSDSLSSGQLDTLSSSETTIRLKAN